MTYLLNLANITDACEWLAAETDEQWTLPRLLEYGLMPWVWLDCSPEHPEVFGDRGEGFLAPFVFGSDVFRLGAERQSALMTMTRTPDDKLLKMTPGLCIALDELRFKREGITELAAKLRSSAPTAPTVMQERDEQRNSNETESPGDWKAQARAIADEHDAANKKGGCHDSLTSMADRVAKSMREREIYGPRGPLGGKTVLREALQGGKWSRKR